MDECSQFQCTGSARFYLPTLRYAISSTALLNDARLCTLAVEDAAWCAAEEDWMRRQPRRRQWRKHRRWIAEYQTLLVARDQLRELARTMGLPIQIGR
jgi:hypothetical protein